MKIYRDCENKIDRKEFFDNSTNKIEIVIRVDYKESVIVTSLIISAVFKSFQLL